ncbi:MAG TPA: hypothetical protein VGF06_07275 [Terriglobales bacterium]|jgi:hypothetical protein
MLHRPSFLSSALSRAFLFLPILLASASAETLSGSVTNGTVKKPAAGDDVVLIRLTQGMDEVARTKTDSKGRFSFNLNDPGAPHLVRAIHQGVTYYKMAPPGVSSVELEVFDVAKRLQDIAVTADVMRIQAQGGSLQVVRRFSLNNSSNPPRTQMNDQNFEFSLPDGAQLDSGMAKTANGQPVNSAPVPQSEKNRYAFIFPLRPGQTEFQVSFHMAYSGSANLDFKSLYPSQHVVVVLPNSMQFSPAAGGSFQAVQGGQSDTQVQIATNTQAGQSLAFKLSGTGTLPPPEPQGSAGSATQSSPPGKTGPPAETPGTSGTYRWYIIGFFALLLAAMAAYALRRPASPAAGTAQPTHASGPAIQGAAGSGSHEPALTSSSATLFQALKEELFELEMEHKQGAISADEYQKAKAALDQTLERAIKRQAKA